jgi:hypothetical protein
VWAPAPWAALWLLHDAAEEEELLLARREDEMVAA